MRSIIKMGAGLTLALMFTITTQAQDKDKGSRPSPMRTATASIPNGEITIHYSAPQVKERKIWDALVPYGKVWRTGANEATTITLTGDVKTSAGLLKAGKYALFTIPGEKEWTIIFNSVWDQWGAYNYSEEKDVLRLTATPRKTDKLVEEFTISVNEQGTVTMAWEYVTVSFDLE